MTIEDRIALTLKAASDRIEVGESPLIGVRTLDPNPRPRTSRLVAFVGAFGAVLLVALGLSLLRPSQPGSTADSPGQLFLSGQPGRGRALEVQEMVQDFASNAVVEGTAVEVGRVSTGMGLASLIRWTTIQNGQVRECWGFIRGEIGMETCGLPRRNQGPIAESTTDDLPIEFRFHTVFVEVPEEVQAIKVTTADGTIVISPAMDGLALAEWQGHGTAHCIVGLRNDGSAVDLDHC